jgi:hypothetical protein
MEREIRRVGWTAERLNGETPEALGFSSGKLRGNWMGHTRMIEKSADYNDTVLVLEDDIVIRDRDRVEECINNVQREAWDVLYLYGATKLKPIKRITNVHAYVVRRDFVPTLVNELNTRREQVEAGGFDSSESFIDCFMHREMQDKYRFWGTEPLIVQDREKFGSDMDWGFKLPKAHAMRGIKKHG